MPVSARDLTLARSLTALSREILCNFALRSGVSHLNSSLPSESGGLYFLGTSAQVGGAHVAEFVSLAPVYIYGLSGVMLEAATS